MIGIYKATFDEDWPKCFERLDNAIKEHIAKKISKILEFPEKRHLKKGVRFFIGEVSQYRIAYRVFEETNEVRFYFIGKHKEYEKWYKQYF